MATSDNSVRRILVVEDEPAICNLCRRVLSLEGFEVDIAASGKAARDIIQRKQYDLYLFDIKMPGTDGEQLFEWLKRQGLEPATKVVFMSGCVPEDDTRARIEESGRPLLSKPFSSSQLVTMVKDTLEALER